MEPAIDLRTSGVTALVAALLVAFAGLGLGGGCGRTDLDLGFDPVNGPSGTGGGAGGAGLGGTPGGFGGGPGPISCGSSFCTPGAQTCCAQPSGGPGSAMCVSAQDPNACPMGVKVGCFNGDDCQTGQSCCFSLAAVASTCQAMGCTFGNLELCDLQAGCSDVTQSCCPISMLLGTGVCLPAGISCSALHF